MVFAAEALFLVMVLTPAVRGSPTISLPRIFGDAKLVRHPPISKANLHPKLRSSVESVLLCCGHALFESKRFGLRCYQMPGVEAIALSLEAIPIGLEAIPSNR